VKACKNRHARGDWSDKPGDAHKRTETIRRGLTVTLADQYRYSYPMGKGHGASACCEHARSIIRVTGVIASARDVERVQEAIRTLSIWVSPEKAVR
jgi:hypothetical protein